MYSGLSVRLTTCEKLRRWSDGLHR